MNFQPIRFTVLFGLLSVGNLVGCRVQSSVDSGDQVTVQPGATEVAEKTPASAIESPSAESPVAESPVAESPVAEAPNAEVTGGQDEGRMLPKKQPEVELSADSPEDWGLDLDHPEKAARAAFEPPANAKSLSKQGRLWVDTKTSRVYLDGYVALRRGQLEMFACPVGTKEHESVVAVLAESRELHAALLAAGATPGAPVQFDPEFVPPTGQVIRIWVCWYGEDGEFQTVDAREWVQHTETEEQLSAEWVFAGSGFWEDPETKQEFYRADSGDMICVSNFASALLDVSIASTAEGDNLLFMPFESRLPKRETPVRLVLIPVPESSKPIEAAKPTASMVVRTKSK